VGIAMAPARMITSEQTLARIGRRMKMSAITAGFGVLGSGFRVRVRVRVLVLYRYSVHELLCAGGDHPLARLDPVENGIVLAGDRADLDRALLRDELAARVFRDEGEELSVDPQDGGDGDHQDAVGLPDDARANVLRDAKGAAGIPDLPFHQHRLRLVVH